MFFLNTSNHVRSAPLKLFRKQIGPRILLLSTKKEKKKQLIADSLGH